MPKYERKAPTFEANRFTGGASNASAAVNWLSPLGFTVRWVEPHKEYYREGDAIKQTPIPEVLKIETTDGDRWEVQVGDWVLVSHFGEINVLKDADFTQLYQPV
jgi:hypothetical protein